MTSPAHGFRERLQREAARRLCGHDGKRVPGWEPDRLRTDATMRDAWHRFFPQAPQSVVPIDRPQTVVGHRCRFALAGRSNGGAGAATGASRWGSSINWSGATTTARDGRAFRAVMTRFRVPEPRLPPGGLPVADLPAPARAYSASVWVGLDGVRPAAPSLPQAGIAVAWVQPPDEPAPRAQLYAWAQWWTTDNLDGEMRARPEFEIRAGDMMRIWVSMEEDGSAAFRMLNERSGKAAGSTWLPEGETDLGAPAELHIGRRPDVQGSAASWVVERPMVLVDPADYAEHYAFDPRPLLFPLPDYGAVQFEDCLALIGPEKGGRSALRDLRACRFLRMYRQDGDRQRVVMQSNPLQGTADSRFEVRYAG